MAFDPDKYLAESEGFDPDAYLGEKPSEPKGPSEIESALRGAAQGATFGFADEIAGGAEALFTDKPYEQARDESRANFKAAEAANPNAYLAGDVGGSVATAMIPGLNVAKGATLAARLGTAAGMGTLSGMGRSEATDEQLVYDTMLGGALGAGFQAGGEKVVSPLLQKVGDKLGRAVTAAEANASPTLNRLLSKSAQFLGRVDEDAALRQIERPVQAAAAEADGFTYNLGKTVRREIDELGSQLGENVGMAKEDFLKRRGGEVFNEAQVLKMQVEDFLRANKPSARGFSALSDRERDELLKLTQMLDGPISGEDLVKVRDYMDHVKRLAGKYDQEGTGPFIGFLKGVRGQADSILDRADEGIDAANRAYSQFADDTSLLRGAVNDGQAESMVANLYGANKGAQQEAASRLMSPESLEMAKDFSANKSFEGAKRPGGDNYFRRNALPVLTLGASEVVTSPDIWKKGLRMTGRLQQAIKSNPQAFGKYATTLTNAMNRGPQALAATTYILSQRDPQYRQMIESMEGQDDE